jgi:malate dehydrogenase (oxaloacetate-decarboxylating)(NADP+)
LESAGGGLHHLTFTLQLVTQEARARCFFMDSKGLVCASRRAELAHHKLPFAHDVPHVRTLLEAVNALKPTALIGECVTGAQAASLLC